MGKGGWEGGGVPGKWPPTFTIVTFGRRERVLPAQHVCTEESVRIRHS